MKYMYELTVSTYIHTYWQTVSTYRHTDRQTHPPPPPPLERTEANGRLDDGRETRARWEGFTRPHRAVVSYRIVSFGREKRDAAGRTPSHPYISGTTTVGRDGRRSRTKELFWGTPGDGWVDGGRDGRGERGSGRAVREDG